MRLPVPRPGHLALRAGRSLVLALLLVGLSVPLVGDSAAVERYMGHVRHLASPEMRGRGAGMPELDVAAAYIAGVFQEAGIGPAGEDGGYLQPFEVTTTAKLGPANALGFERKGSAEELELGKDFIPINFSSSGEAAGELVFVGYGASATELDYDDYFHLDVRDKIVLVMRYEPEFFTEGDGQRPSEGRQRRGRRMTRHSHLIAKAIQARQRGAKAVLLVDAQANGRRGNRLIRFGSVSGPTDAGIPMAQVSAAVAEGWLRGSGRSLRLLRRDIEESRRPQSFPLATALRVRLSVDVEQVRATVSNVAAYLPGESEEYMVLGAHYDHLGLGGEGSLAPQGAEEPHLGADDNASGVAAILELARHYATQQRRRRGILFLAFAAEEIGLLGSSHWADNPTLPLEQAVAMFNFDMVGRIEGRRLYVGGTGTAEPFGEMLSKAAQAHGFSIDLSKDSHSSSDHTSFAAKKIPVLFFFSGLHSDYHKPSDTADKIDGKAAVAMLGLARDLVNSVLVHEPRLEFVEQMPQSREGRQSGDGERSGYGPWFGSVPDFGEVPDGVRFADVRTGSPAAKAGLRAGDVLTHWNDAEVKNLYDFTYALRDSEVGERVRVRFLRDGEPMAAEVTLAPRP